MRGVFRCFKVGYYLAKELEHRGRFSEAKKCYERILLIGEMMYNEAEEYVRERIALEEKWLEDYRRGLEYYQAGKWEAAKDVWRQIRLEAKPGSLFLQY